MGVIPDMIHVWNSYRIIGMSWMDSNFHMALQWLDHGWQKSNSLAQKTIQSAL